MSFLTAAIVKNSNILAGIYFIFLKGRPRKKPFKTKNRPPCKDQKSSYHVRPILGLFRKLVVVTLS